MEKKHSCSRWRRTQLSRAPMKLPRCRGPEGRMPERMRDMSDHQSEERLAHNERNRSKHSPTENDEGDEEYEAIWLHNGIVLVAEVPREAPRGNPRTVEGRNRDQVEHGQAHVDHHAKLQQGIEPHVRARVQAGRHR